MECSWMAPLTPVVMVIRGVKCLYILLVGVNKLLVVSVSDLMDVDVGCCKFELSFCGGPCRWGFK